MKRTTLRKLINVIVSDAQQQAYQNADYVPDEGFGDYADEFSEIGRIAFSRKKKLIAAEVWKNRRKWG